MSTRVRNDRANLEAASFRQARMKSSASSRARLNTRIDIEQNVHANQWHGDPYIQLEITSWSCLSTCSTGTRNRGRKLCTNRQRLEQLKGQIKPNVELILRAHARPEVR